ncbi:MAG: hypothetical protein WBA43_05245 [Elainellaceae cyanobacterium]|jgi:hypothetical protein
MDNAWEALGQTNPYLAILKNDDSFSSLVGEHSTPPEVIGWISTILLPMVTKTISHSDLYP